MDRAVTSLSLVTASVPRIKQVLAAGGSGLSYPQIQESEQSTADKSNSDPSSRGLELKLVPSDTIGQVTVTVTSGGRKENEKVSPDWQGMMTVGSKEDEHTSTSSLFDDTDREGVMLEREFEMVVEKKR